MLFTNEMAKDIVEEMLDNANTNIVIHDEETKGVRNTTLKDEINPLFCTYQKDELARGFYGSNEEQQENYIETISQNLQQTRVLVELTKNEPLAIQDFKGGNVTITCTFFIPTDKVAVLDTWVSKLRDKRAGYIEYNTFEYDNIKYSSIASISELVIQDASFLSPIGMATICTLSIELGYLQYCSFYGENYIEMSLDGSTYTKVPLIKFDIAMSYNTQANTTQNNPKAIGDISTSASISMNFTYYELSDNEIFEKIRSRCLSVCTTEYSNNYESNDDKNLQNIIWVKYNHDGGEYTYKMVVRSYSTSGTNADFMQASLSLGLSAL